MIFELSTHPNVLCEPLQERRVKICEVCLKKSADHPKYQNWFRMDENLVNERNTRKVNKCSKQKYHSVQYKQESYKNSTLSYLRELLNTMVVRAKSRLRDNITQM